MATEPQLFIVLSFEVDDAGLLVTTSIEYSWWDFIRQKEDNVIVEFSSIQIGDFCLNIRHTLV